MHVERTGNPTIIQRKLSIQPISGRELRALEESLRQRVRYKAYGDVGDMLRVAGTAEVEENGQTVMKYYKPDEVFHDDQWLHVETREILDSGILPHVKYTLSARSVSGGTPDG